MKNKYEFKIKNNFYYRYPYFSYNLYHTEMQKDINSIVSDVKNNYMENLLISSQPLYEAVANNSNTKNRDMSIYKYMLRSMVRCTPYGINAGVGIGKFDNNNHTMALGENHKKVRVDMEWLIQVIRICEEKIGSNLMVVNSKCYSKTGNRLQKYYDSCYVKDGNSNNKGSSIIETKLVSEILRLTNEYTSINNLMKKLLSSFGLENETKINNVIHELIRLEFLNSNLKISLLTDNPFKDFLNILSEYNIFEEIFLKLREIDALIDIYSNYPIGLGENEYLSIIYKMSKLHKVDNYLQVDMYNDSEVTLDDEIKNDVEEFANYFISRCINETYNDYVDRFRELYGEQAVKLSDVLDIEKGLGIPTVDGENTQQYIEWWLTILFDHIVNVKNKNYIDLSEMKNQFPFKYDNDQLKFPLSFELSLYLLNDNGNKKYVISPMLGSESKWKSFGRFGYLFNENIIGDDLNKKNKGFKEVEITFYPTKSHDANVAICNMNKSSYLELNTYETLNGKEKIDIDDIYMYIDKNSKISFVQGSTNEVLNFSTTNKYITNSFPDILKTIMEVDKKQKPCFESFFYALMKIIGNLSGHIPEIRYKNFIISQECWKIDNRKLFDNGKYLKYDDFVILINDMLITHEFPIEICTGPIDRKLILNMTKDTDMKILYKMLKENTNLAIYKNLFSIDNLILKNKNNEKYICEFVFQFEQKKVNNPELVYSSKRIPLIDNNFIDSVKYYPFNEWITINLYVNENIMDKLLINQIRYLFLSLMNDKSITSFFYIRYRDPKNHLRLRFKINNNYAAVIQEVNNLINILQERSLLNNLKYDVYVPEVNRYGGFDCYLLAEKVFYINSIISMNLIDMVDKKICVLSKEQIFLIGAYKMIQDMGINDVELLEYIKRYKLNKNLKNAYIEIGKDILPFFKKWSTNIDDMFHSSSELLNLYIELEKGKDAYRSYWLSINTIYNDNNFDNFIVKRYCLNSILHMFFNRLIGINRDVENVVMGVLEKIVHDKIQKEKMYGIK